MSTDRISAARPDWGALLSSLAHEIRNPLSTINLNLQLLREEPALSQIPGGGRAARKLDVVLAEVVRLERMLADFQRLVSDGPLDRTPSDVNEIVEGLLDFESGSFKKHDVEISAHLDRGLPRVDLDANLLRQALINVIKNSLDAVGSGGGTITVSTRSSDGFVVIEVIDTGVGMSPETLRRAFTVYFSTKASGSGLGLPMVKRIVERHGGRIRCESSLGVGTRVSLELPMRGTLDEPT